MGSPATTEKLKYFDLYSENSNDLDEIVTGMSKIEKSISPKFFYDEKGLNIIDAVYELPEYYLTRTEKQILSEAKEEICRLIGKDSIIIEPGSGNSEKVRPFLNELNPKSYVPMDFSIDYLKKVAESLHKEYPELELYVVCTDYVHHFQLPDQLPEGKRVVFFPGSTLGNLEPNEVVTFLQSLAKGLGKGGGLLIGIDLQKDKEVVELAYNDPQGVCKAFYLNVFDRLNAEYGANFQADNFQYQVYYNEEFARVEKYFVSNQNQTINIGSHFFKLEADESIRAENSYKFTVDQFHALAETVGFSPVRLWTDPLQLFSVHYLEVL
ncbi:MAG: L-histidine N(alpha)-methyltransferase [Chlamydiota bacterium]